jgi:uncharacterized protein
MAYDLQVRFEWDDGKNVANQEKHDVSFEEARELFTSGQDHLEIFDDAHSEVEDRFIAIGPISRGLVLVVWTERDEDVIRIVSARWASKRERQMYTKHMERQT